MFKVAPSSNELQVLNQFDFVPNCTTKQFKLIRWIPPIFDLCLNVDGACKGNPGECGGGDRQGNVHVAFAHFYGVGNSMIAELRALCDDLRLADFLDSKSLVNSFKQGRCSSWTTYRRWRDAWTMLNRDSIFLSHVYWETN
ncbi:hypothetical protein Taro_033632 [Colocasia esculenta]|uniref:RNase H type-1 domain-containing protein n=1 Tax=Colocasia esculenta TaxID=4460 RepID=A0A843W5A3_COLES|nr:hypothetical protein [Colocasia esculenta]